MVTQYHQGMEEQICDFIDNLFSLAPFCSEENLAGFLCDFFENRILSALDELVV